MHDLHMGGLTTYALRRGGSLHPIILPKSVTGNEQGIMNPSVFVHEGKVLVNIRHINYILYHSEGKKFPHAWGPLVYVHPQNDVALKTTNIVAEFDSDLNLVHAGRVNTSEFDTKPTWNFVGLEDARLFEWDGRLFLCGVRRDCYDDKGKGRMELQEIEFHDGEWKEVGRFPIPAPNGDGSYCEKNWMPILDQPYQFVKWCNPMQVVKYDIEEGTTEDVVNDPDKTYDFMPDMRGGSQVLRINENQQIAFIHETSLYRDPFNRKDGSYQHRIVVWDNDWNVVHRSVPFYFMGNNHDHARSMDFAVEFAVGAAFYGNDILISFGVVDNCSFILRMPQDVFMAFLKGEG